MTRLLTLLLLCLSLTMQSQVQPFQNGFYRARNTASTGWIFLYDDYSDGVLVSGSKYDVSALSTYKSFNNIVSNCGSVIYMEKDGSGYNLYAQGTDVKTFSGGLVLYLRKHGNADEYVMYGKSNYGEVRLFDINSSGEEGEISTTGDNEFCYWQITPVSAETDNYFALTPTVEADGNHYGSFYASFAALFASPSMDAFYVKRVTDDGAAIIAPVQNKVPAHVPVVVKCASASYSANRITPLFETADSIADNQLRGVFFCHIFDRKGSVMYKGFKHRVYTEFDPSSMRVLGKTADGRLGMVSSTSAPSVTTFTDSDGKTVHALSANSCYLPVAPGTNAELPLLTEEEYLVWQEQMSVRGIMSDASSVRPGVFTLSGQRLSVTDLHSIRRGLYIVNGRKHLVRSQDSTVR